MFATGPSRPPVIRGPFALRFGRCLFSNCYQCKKCYQYREAPTPAALSHEQLPIQDCYGVCSLLGNILPGACRPAGASAVYVGGWVVAGFLE